MRKLYLILLFALSFTTTWAQTDIVIGTGTAGNPGSSGTTGYPCPLQDYYEGSRAQYLYLASELTSAGMAAGNISAIKFEVANLNGFTGSVEQMQVSIGTTTTSTLSTAWEPVSTVVYGPVDYAVTLGTNTLTFTAPFNWNGTDNIIIEICNGDPNNASATYWTDNPTVTWTTGLAFNGSHTYRFDNVGSLCTTTNATNYGNQTTRPNITFAWTPSSTTGCFGPTGATVSGVTSTGASATWNAPTIGTPPGQYKWEVRSSGTGGSGATGLAASGLTASTNATITGLASGTFYRLYVRSNCGATDTSSWAASSLFNTLCSSTGVPYTEDFESATVPGFPICVSEENAGTGNDWTTVSNPGYGFTTKAAQYAYNSASAANTWFYTQGLNLTAGVSYRLTFKYGASGGTTYTESMEVKYGSSPASASMSDLIVDYPAINLNGSTTSVTDFTPATSGTYYIGFHAYSIADQDFLFVDDISVMATPTCDIPTGITKSNITTTGLQLDWTAPAIGSPSAYNIYFTTSTTPPTGTTTPSASTSGTSYTASTLTPGTKYYFYMRTVCGTSGTSVWTPVDSFTTVCTAITTFSENFDASLNLPVCWAKVGTAGSAYVQSGSAASSPNTLYMYGTATGQPVVSMPPVSNLGAGTYRLTFKLRANFTIGGIVEVGYLTNPSDSSTFTMLQSFTTTSTGYQTYTVDPGTAPGTAEVLAFRHTGTPANSLLIDDVSWLPIPSCEVPTGVTVSNVTTSGAQIDWTAPAGGGTPSGYQVYYSTSSTPPTPATTPSTTTTNTTAVLTGLTSATMYYVYVRTNCGTAGTSTWTVADSFATACTPTGVPYSVDFEGSLNIPVCTSVENAGQGNIWEIQNNPGAGFTTNTLVYPYSSSAAADAWFYTRGLTLTAGTSYRLTFKYGNNSTFYTEKLEVKYGTSAAAASMTDLIVDYPAINTNTQMTSVSDFTPTTTGTYYIGFHAYSVADQFDLYVDDIAVTASPTCIEPGSVAVDNASITTTAATVNWVAPSSTSPSSYQLYYSTSSTPPTGTTTPTTSGITTTSSALSGLSPATTYYVYLRSNCGTGGVSAWTTGVSFTTLCDTVGSFVQNFDTPTAPAMPACWTSFGAAGTGVVEATSPSSTPNALRIYVGGYVSTQPVSPASTTNNTLQFEMRGTVTAGGIIEVGYLATPGDSSTFVLLATDTASTLTYQTFSVAPGTLPGTQIQFAFRHTATPTASVLIDNVQWSRILPVRLTTFTGEKRGSINVLHWSTASEQNNRGFEVLRSVDGVHFSSIGFVNTKASGGNSSSSIEYLFNDENPSVGNTYYRLKQVNTDGHTELSNVVLIKGRSANVEFSSVYPNPASSRLNVVLAAPANEKVTLIITDVTGRVIMQQQKQLISGDNAFAMNVAHLASGTYMVKAICDNGCETSIMRFVKK